MVEVTDSAIKNIKAYLAQNNIDSAIRVAMMGGCGGPSLGLAIDESTPNDQVHEQDDLRFLVDKELLTQCGSVKIDFVEPTATSGCGCGGGGGYVVSSANPLAGAGGGCGCSGGSCSSSGCDC